MFDKSKFIELVNEDIKSLLSKQKPEVYGMLEEYIFRGGKRARPLLMNIIYKLCGGKNEESIIRYGTIIELFHNFSLIHDDIEDHSKFRRGKETLHMLYGIPIALNSGDALYTLVWCELLKLDKNISKVLGNAFKKVVEGQGLELDLIYKNKYEIDYEEYYEIVKGKTAALISATCEVGALLAGNKNPEIFREFGENLGIAFQIWDDILNLEGDFETYKKEIGGDINEGKRTLMVAYALKHGNETQKQRLLEILKKQPNSEEEIKEAIEIIRQTNALEFAKQEYKKYTKKVHEILEKIEGDKSELTKFVEKIINRNQ